MDDTKRPLLSMVMLGLALAAYLGYEQYKAATNPPAEPIAEQAADAPHAATPPAADAPLSDSEQAERARHQTRVSIRTPEMEAVFTDRNAGLIALRLLEPRFQNTVTRNGSTRTVPENLVSTRFEQFLPLRQTVGGVTMPRDATYRAEQVDARTVRFTWDGDGFHVVRTVRAGSRRYTLESETVVSNASRGARPVRVTEHTYRYVPRSAEGGGMFRRASSAATQGFCETAETKMIEPREKIEEDTRGMGPHVRFAGWGTNYFASALAARRGDAERCVVASSPIGNIDEPDGSVVSVDLRHARRSVAPGASAAFTTVAYFGPKDLGSLTAAGHHFDDAVDLGFFGFIARYLVLTLRYIHGVIGNWGIAIILLTFAVRLLLYPLTAASLKSMGKMRILKPELDRIQAQFGDDQEKRGAAMMALYKQHNINPFAGCLPSLAQMPIWLALYTSLSTNIELYHAEFLAWHDLSAPDPWFVLPAALAALMFLQQKMTPTTMDPVQAKIMLYMMPAMMGAFMLFLPAGLCVYMLTNSTLGIVQQKYIQWRLDQEPVAAVSNSADAPATDAKPAAAGEASGGKKGSRRGRA